MYSGFVTEPAAVNRDGRLFCGVRPVVKVMTEVSIVFVFGLKVVDLGMSGAEGKPDAEGKAGAEGKPGAEGKAGAGGKPGAGL